MVHRNIEKTLQLRRMQIHDQRPVRACRSQQISHQLGRNRAARFIFAVLPRIAKVRNHRRDAPRRSTLQRIDQQQQLHQVLVHTRAAAVCLDRAARGLHHEHVAAAHVLLDLHIALAIGEACDLRLTALHAQELADFIGQGRIGGAAEDLELVVRPRALGLAFRFLVRARLFFRARCDSGHVEFSVPGSQFPVLAPLLSEN